MILVGGKDKSAFRSSGNPARIWVFWGCLPSVYLPTAPPLALSNYVQSTQDLRASRIDCFAFPRMRMPRPCP